MILADAHVHIYDCFDLVRYLDAAYSNFRSQADRLGHADKFTPILLLAETEKDHWFDRLRGFAGGNRIHGHTPIKKWEFHHTGESVSISACSGSSFSLFIIAGSQVETEEGLEVLALGTAERFRSGQPLIDLTKEVKKHNGIPVIPWGFGKWWGRRGKVLDDFLKTQRDKLIYLGDNSGRPSFFPFPYSFKVAKRNGIKILPGSDPLPFSTEFDRAGSFGFLLEGNISETHPAESLKQILLESNEELQPYGNLENPFRFFRNQLKMQFKKQYSKYKV
jgi:hypothetical protein